MIYSYNKDFNQHSFKELLLREDIVTRTLNKISVRYKNKMLKDLGQKKIKTEIVEACICGSKKLDKLSNVDRFGLPFGSNICKDCGLILTSPRIKQESLPYYYDNIYHPLNFGKEKFTADDALFDLKQGQKIFHKISPFIHRNKINVLEIGAGTGSVLKGFIEEASKVNIEVEALGTEYKTEFIKLCNENGLNVVHGDIDTIKKTKIKYDVIILSHVFEHFIDLIKELDSLNQIIKKNGVLYVEVPGVMANHKKGGYKFSYLGYHVHAHMYNFTLTTLHNVISRHGWQMVEGNENVEAVFKLNNSVETILLNDYPNILYYLNFISQNQLYLVEEYEKNKFFEYQYNQQQQTINNREKTIAGKELLLKKNEQLIKEQTLLIDENSSIIKEQSLETEDLKNLLKEKELVIKEQIVSIRKLVGSIDEKELFIENLTISMEDIKNQLRDKDKLIEKQSQTIKNREKTIEGKIWFICKQNKELAIAYNYYYMIVNAIDKISQTPLFRKPLSKFRSYKEMLIIYHSIRRNFK